MDLKPDNAALFIPQGLSAFKNKLFERIGAKVGRVVRYSFDELDGVPDDIVPVVGCTPELRPIIDRWIARKRTFVYWDRGYCDRVFATCLPTGDDGGYYRWHVNAFQMQHIRPVPDDRWKSLKCSHVVRPWARGGRHIVIAAPTRTYSRFHHSESWILDTLHQLALVTDRQIVIRDKEQYKRRPIQKDLEGAHALISHGSIAAVESVILGCPVFVDKSSAAALVGQTDVSKIESPVYPDREPWLRSLAYCQYNEAELVDGTLWRLLE